MSRLVNRLLAYEDVRDAQAIGMRSQLDRMEKTLNNVATREPPVREVIIREIERGPPPVPAKDEPSESPSSSSSSSSTSKSSSSTATPVKKIPRKPPPSLPSDSETESQDSYTVADTGMADAETSSVHSDSSEETAMPTTPQMASINLDITSRLDHMDSLFGKVLGQQQMLMDELDRRDPSRFEQLLARVLAMHLGGSGTSSPTSTVRSLWPEGDFYPGVGSVSSKDDPRTPHANTVASLGSSSLSSQYHYDPSADPEFRDMPTPLGSEVTPPWMPPPMELPDSIVNRFRQKGQPKQNQPQQSQPPQQTVIYYPQQHTVPGEYPRQPSPQESVPEHLRDADSNDGHGERDIRPIPFTIEREPPRARERPHNAPTFDSDERNNIYRGPTPQEDLGLPTPPQDRRWKDRDLPQVTTAPPVFNPGPVPGSAPLPNLAPGSAFVQPPRAQTMPPGPVPARGTPGFVPHMPTSGLRNSYPSVNPLRTPARTPMTTPWRRGFGPGWRPPMVRNMGVMQPGLRPGMFPGVPVRPGVPGGLHRRWGSGLDAVDEHRSSHGSDAGSVSSSSSKTTKSSKSSKSTSVSELKKQNEQELAEIEKKRNELEKEQKAFEDAQAKDLAAHEAEEAEKVRAEERKRIEDESRARDQELEDKFEEKLEEELDRIKKSHLESQAAQPSPQPQPVTPISAAAVPETPVIHIDVASPHSHKSYRSYPMSRYSSSISSVSPSSASEEAILTPNTNNIQVRPQYMIVTDQ